MHFVPPVASQVAKEALIPPDTEEVASQDALQL